MADFTTTEGAVFIPEVWSKVALIARDERIFMGDKVLRKDSDVKQMGDRINIPEVAKLTANAVGAGGSITPQAPTETERILSIDQWFEASVDITDRLKVQSMYDLFRIYSERIGKAIGVQVETTLMNLAQVTANFVNGLNGADLTDIRIVDGIRRLDSADAPRDGRWFAITPGQKAVVLQIDKFVRADAIPFIKSDSPIVKGMFGDIYGVGILPSNLIPLDVNNRDSDGDTDEFLNIMFQTEAMALAIQQEIDMQLLAKVKLSQPMVGNVIFGVTPTRDDHAIIFNTPNASG